MALRFSYVLSAAGSFKALFLNSNGLSCSQLLLIARAKSKATKRGKKSDQDDSDDEENQKWEETTLDSTYTDVGHDFKDVVTRVSSTRLDTILKAGLGLSNSKIETAFYDSKLRLNGEKVMKKSLQMNLGDEADLIIDINGTNQKFVDVMRVILHATKTEPDKEKITVKLRRFKSLTINNYPSPNNFKGVVESD